MRLTNVVTIGEMIMCKKILLWILFLATGLLANTSLMAEQSESPVACNEGSEPVSLVYADHTTGCEVSPATDLDTFLFDGVAGEQIRISLLSKDYYFDPRLEIRDPGGAVIHDEACSGGGSPTICSFIVEIPLPLTGTYFIAISDSGTNEPGRYEFNLERIPPLALTSEIVDDVAIDDRIAPATDMDSFLFQANAGTDIRVSVLSKDYYFDPRLEIRDPDGVVIHDEACSGGGSPTICSFTVDLSLTLTGNYVVSISDSGVNEAGRYQVQTQCLSPTGCPGPAPRAGCAIDMSQAVYIDGETITADAFRIVNLNTAPLALEWKVWLVIPNLPPISLINLGADGSFALPSGTDVDLGPLPLLPVTAVLPRGAGYELSCRLLDPVTGRLLMEDRNFFELQ